MNDNEQRDMKALKKIHAEIATGTIRLYRNALRQPYVYCDHPDFPPLCTGLFDADFRAWLMTFVHTKCDFLLHEREQDRILGELAGRSLRHPIASITDPVLLRCLETEPVLAVVAEFMHTRPRHESTMEALWKELRKFARGRRLLRLGSKQFPGGPNVLSRKLRNLQHLLQLLGIEININRSNGCKITLTRRLDGSPAESSAVPSATKQHDCNDLTSLDDRSARLANLEARRRRDTQE